MKVPAVVMTLASQFARTAILALSLCFTPSFAEDQQARPQKQIVILYTHRTLTPINADWDRGIRSSLADRFDEPLDIEIEYLNLVRHQNPEYLHRWIELLKTKYSDNPPDLVIPVYVPALQFTLENRAALFPDIPIVFCSAPPQLAELAHSQSKVTGVAFRLDYAGTIAAARQLHPTNRRLVVLTGSSAPERAAKLAAERAIHALNTGMEVEYWEGLPLRLLIQKLQKVDGNTSALMLTYDEDIEGNYYSTVEITEQLESECSVPIYGLYDTLLGHGIVGGCLGSAESQGRLAGELASGVLSGESPNEMPIVGIDPAKYKFDGRQLNRWHLSEASLPPDSLVLYRQTTFWGQYGRYVLLSVVALLLQSTIIIALLVNRSRRVHAERDARELAGKILTAQEDERRYLARELHDDLSQRLAATAIEAGNLELRLRTSPESSEIASVLKEHLIEICDDLHRLSRRLHSSLLDDFGLEDALRSECSRFEERDGIPVEFRSGDLPKDIPDDIALCLYRIAQESLRNTEKYSKTNRVLVELNADPEFLHLEIRDFGCGFDRDQVSQQGGLGLASMNERVRLVRGTIQIVSSPGQGVAIVVQIPLPEDLI